MKTHYLKKKSSEEEGIFKMSGRTPLAHRGDYSPAVRTGTNRPNVRVRARGVLADRRALPSDLARLLRPPPLHLLAARQQCVRRRHRPRGQQRHDVRRRSPIWTRQSRETVASVNRQHADHTDARRTDTQSASCTAALFFQLAPCAETAQPELAPGMISRLAYSTARIRSLPRPRVMAHAQDALTCNAKLDSPHTLSRRRPHGPRRRQGGACARTCGLAVPSRPRLDVHSMRGARASCDPCDGRGTRPQRPAGHAPARRRPAQRGPCCQALSRPKGSTCCPPGRQRPCPSSSPPRAGPSYSSSGSRARRTGGRGGRAAP